MPHLRKLWRHPYAKWVLALCVVVGVFLLVQNASRSRHYRVDPLADVVTQASRYRVVASWDQHGIPHISGRRDADIAFGLGYAHASDNLPSLERALIDSRGARALLAGRSAVAHDAMVRILAIRQAAERAYLGDAADAPAHLGARLPQPVLDYLDAFAAGVNYAIIRGVTTELPWLYPVSAIDLVAMAHYYHLKKTGLFAAYRALADGTGTAPERYLDEPAVAVAVAPHKSWGSTLFLFNRQGALGKAASPYTAVVHSDEGISWHGFTHIGFPYFTAAFNAHMAWGASDNSPQTYDIYPLETRGAGAQRRYLADAIWHPFAEQTVRVPYKWLGEIVREQVVPYRLANRDLAFASDGEGAMHALAAYDLLQAQELRQWHSMHVATDFASWQQALAERRIPTMNFTYADKDGRIFTRYNGHLRARDQVVLADAATTTAPRTASAVVAAGGDLPSLGNTRRPDDANPQEAPVVLALDPHLTTRIPLVPTDSLPQIDQPASGYVALANQTPLRMTAAFSAPSAEDFPSLWGIETGMSNRAQVLLAHLTRGGALTYDQLLQLKYSTAYSPDYPPVQALLALLTEDFAYDAQLLDAQKTLHDWDLTGARTSRGSALAVCLIQEMQAGRQHADDEVHAALRTCAETMRARGWELARPLDIQLEHDGTLMPLDGAPDTLRNTRFVYDKRAGVNTAVAGDSLVLAVSWDRDLSQRAEFVLPRGLDSEKGSIHYDNMLQNYLAGKLIPLGGQREDAIIIRLPFDH